MKYCTLCIEITNKLKYSYMGLGRNTATEFLKAHSPTMTFPMFLLLSVTNKATFLFSSHHFLLSRIFLSF